MAINEKDIEEIQKLEESLWRTETRFDLNYMERILAPDFFEFGRSGRIYQRNDTLHGARPQVINAKIPLKNFKITTISDNTCLVTYISEVMYEGLEVGNRSSIWSKTEKGWQIRFHQGTVTK